MASNSPATTVPCDAGHVCVAGPLAEPVCLADDGSIPISGGQCRPGHERDDCQPHQACVIMVLPEGELGYCASRCERVDDRPACVPGCFNQLCSGAHDLCGRDHGACQPVPCTADADCAALSACDYPGRQEPGFRCDLEAGACRRSWPEAADSTSPP